MKKLALAVLLACAACAAPEASDEGSSSAAVVAGEAAPWERPEVGRFQACTGTLVATNVVLSAAHCFDFESSVRSVGLFAIDRPSGSRAFPTAEVQVFGEETGASDIALVRLAEAVPSDVARPASLARLAPTRGASATMFGYGCTARPAPLVPSQPGNIFTSGQAGDKRKVTFAWGTESHHACPGDSGGPVFDARGAVIGVVSAYFNLPADQGGGFDIFAEPAPRLSELERRIAAWR